MAGRSTARNPAYRRAWPALHGADPSTPQADGGLWTAYCSKYVVIYSKRELCHPSVLSQTFGTGDDEPDAWMTGLALEIYPYMLTRRYISISVRLESWGIYPVTRKQVNLLVCRGPLGRV